jgi:hypothetical protein
MTEEQSPVSCHAPLHAGHPVIPARKVEAPPWQIGRSVITGSSAYADDDDREYDTVIVAPHPRPAPPDQVGCPASPFQGEV